MTAPGPWAGHTSVALPLATRGGSGSGAAIDDLGEQSSIRCRAKDLPGLDGVQAWELDAPTVPE